MRERRVQFNTLKKGVDFMKKKKTLFMMLLSVFVLMAVLGVNVYAKEPETSSVLTPCEASKKKTKGDFLREIQDAVQQLESDDGKFPVSEEYGISMSDEPDAAAYNASWIEDETYAKWFSRLDDYMEMDTWILNLRLVRGADGNGDEDILINPADSTQNERLELTYYDENDNERKGTAITEILANISYSGTDIDELASKLDTMYEKTYEYALISYETFIMDHPEVFWLSYEYFIATTDIEVTLSADGVYYVNTKICFVTQLMDENNQVVFDIRHSNYNEDSIRKGIKERNQLLKSITEPVKDKSPLEQVEYFNNYLTMNNELNYTYYDEAGQNKMFETHPETYSCLGALRGTSGEFAPYEVSYIRAFQTLCDYVDLPCTIELGTAGNSSFGGSHSWNLVEIDKKWYAVDCALNDLSTNVGQAVSGDETTEFLLVGNKSLVTFGGETLTFEESHNASNIYLTGLEYVNSPKIEEYGYNSSIASIKLKATETNYMYGYMEAPVISAEVSLSSDDSETAEYRWYLTDPKNNITYIEDAEGTAFTLTEVTEPGTYEVILEIKLGISKKYETISLETTIFKDVKDTDWFYKAIDWSIANRVTYGLTSSAFGPYVSCTRAQIVTFLWRAAGSPEPVHTDNNFKDVKESDYFYEATLWAVENKILSGYTEDMFAPDVACTRAEMVTFLWRKAGRQEVEDKVHPYKDVSGNGFYYDAMLWAVREGIAKGYTTDMFAPNVTVTRSETVTFLYRADGNANPPAKNEGPSRILEAKEAFDDNVLYHIPNTYVEDGVMQEVQIYENHLLVWGSGLDENGNSAVKIAILDMFTGEPIQKAAFTGFELPDVQVCDEVISVTDSASGRVLLLDGGLKILKEIEGQAEYCTVHVNWDASKIYTFTSENGLIITDIASNTSTVILENTVNLFSNDRIGNTVAITYTDTETKMDVNAVVDLANGNVLIAPFMGSFSNVQYNNGVWTACSFDDMSQYYIMIDDAFYTVIPEGINPSLSQLAVTSSLLAESYDEQGFLKLTLYDTDGKFVSECNINIAGAGFFYDPVELEKDNGYYFIITDPEGKDMLMFWDMSASTEGKDLKYEAVSKDDTVGTEVSRELYERANALSDEYGIDIKIAEFCITESGNYAVESVLNEERIANALDTIEEALSNYPDGFISQLCYGSQNTLELHLGGSIQFYNEAQDYYEMANGFAKSIGSKNIMAVNITISELELLKTVYHEIMHLIDYKLAFDASISEGALYSEDAWNALNPDDFKYIEEYDKLPDGYYNDGNNDWFIDTYARTNGKEDRARLMEYAMIEDSSMFAGYPERLAKLEYVAACIRDAFDTTGWPESTVWEVTLNDNK